jgi:hypothetical protein
VCGALNHAVFYGQASSARLRDDVAAINLIAALPFPPSAPKAILAVFYGNFYLDLCVCALSISHTMSEYFINRKRKYTAFEFVYPLTHYGSRHFNAFKFTIEVRASKTTLANSDI